MPDWTPEDPLARTLPETQRANTALRDYALLGPGRSLIRLSERYRSQSDAKTGPTPPSVRLSTLKSWSSAHDWQARIEAWDRLKQSEEEAEWTARRREIRSQDWKQGADLRDLAAQILAEGPSFIKARRRTQPGSPRVIDADGRVISPGEPEREIVTLALDGALLIRAAKTGSDLQRLAAGMETERQTVDTQVSGSLSITPEVDTSNFDPDQTARYLSAVAQYAGDLAARILANGTTARTDRLPDNRNVPPIAAPGDNPPAPDRTPDA